MEKNISTQRPNGKSLNAYLIESKKNDCSIIVIQEWWGLNDQIKSVGKNFAKEGYQALVPDLYRGKVALDAHVANHL